MSANVDLDNIRTSLTKHATYVILHAANVQMQLLAHHALLIQPFKDLFANQHAIKVSINQVVSVADVLLAALHATHQQYASLVLTVSRTLTANVLLDALMVNSSVTVNALLVTQLALLALIIILA